MDQRRAERGRPQINRWQRNASKMTGNLKEGAVDEVAEWVEEEEIASYHTFTIPYGPNVTASKIDRLLFQKDMLLNAEWNKQKNREVNLHRHPAFFGHVEDVSITKSFYDKNLRFIYRSFKIAAAHVQNLKRMKRRKLLRMNLKSSYRAH